MMTPTIRRCTTFLLLLPVIACGSDAADSLAITATPAASAPSVIAANGILATTVGASVLYDASKGGTTFSDPAARGLVYTTIFSPSTNGLSAIGCEIRGTPGAPGVTTVTVTATDTFGRTASDRFAIVVFASGLSAPTLPAVSERYSDATAPLPGHYFAQGQGGAVIATDNMPATNPTTDAGATLGRVLFHDTRMSANDRVSCASCHIQSLGFGDTARFSRGFAGGLTKRHAMGLANARFYQRGRFFWDERAATLEAQVLAPIQDTTEMGMTLDALALKLAGTTYYRPLFQSAFGTTEITSDRIARALAQYTRSLVSGGSKFDRAFTGGGQPNFAGVFTAQEQQGEAIFRTAGCARCHGTSAQVGDDIHNTGLDATVTDVGAGNGRFKVPSLRNVALRAPYMHDGRFATLAQVVEFYNSGVQANPNLDNRLRVPGGAPLRLNLSLGEKAALVAFLGTLTDSTMINAAKFSNPFAR